MLIKHTVAAALYMCLSNKFCWSFDVIKRIIYFCDLWSCVKKITDVLPTEKENFCTFQNSLYAIHLKTSTTIDSNLSFLFLDVLLFMDNLFGFVLIFFLFFFLYISEEMSIFRNPVLGAKIKHSKLFYSESTIDWQNIQVLLFSQNQLHTCVDCTFLLACWLALIQYTDHHSLKMLDFVFHLYRNLFKFAIKINQINLGVIAHSFVKINLSCISFFVPSKDEWSQSVRSTQHTNDVPFGTAFNSLLTTQTLLVNVEWFYFIHSTYTHMCRCCWCCRCCCCLCCDP